MEQNRRSILLVGIAIVLAARTAAAQHSDRSDEIDLKLAKVKAMQVTATLIAPSEAGLTLETLKRPFKAALGRRGIAVDSNNYQNVISTDLEVVNAGTASAPMYVANLSMHYSETCVAKRLTAELMCNLWDHFEGLHTFRTREALSSYVERTASQWADAFALQAR
jgi:hypothetical protein